MNFLPYEDVPLALDNGNGTEYIFAESATLSVNQPLEVNRQLDDNVIQICAYGNGSTVAYQAQNFIANQNVTVTLGPTNGPPQPLATSIRNIPADTKITFPNNKHLYFTDTIIPNGNNFVVELYSTSGNWNLTEEESQNGYFEPLYEYSASGPIEGTLDVNFYVDSNNLSKFFNITGLANPTQFPPIDEESLAGAIGNFVFAEAYLTNFSFGISPNSISQASASFNVYGEITQGGQFLAIWNQMNNNNMDPYDNDSISHGQYSNIVGTSSFDMEHPIKFNYNISVDRSPRYSLSSEGYKSSDGMLPTRVSKKATTISMSVEGENLSPYMTSDNNFHGKAANLTANLFDLSYEDTDFDSNGLIHSFQCSGVVTSESVNVSSEGYLNGSVSVVQTLT